MHQIELVQLPDMSCPCLLGMMTSWTVKNYYYAHPILCKDVYKVADTAINVASHELASQPTSIKMNNRMTYPIL